MAAVILAGVARQGRQQTCAALSAAYTNKRHQSDLTAYRRGRGGRSSFSGIVATVFGASGFLGRYVVNKLGKIGSQIIVPYRSDPYFVQRLKLAGDLGQVLFYPCQLKDEESIRKAVSRSNVVINLIGRDFETSNYSYEDVHVTGARNIARISRECGVKTLVHMSAMNASENPQKIFMKNGSEWLKSKARGEDAVREEFPEAIIMRPSDIFGTEDRFILYYINPWRRSLGVMPMWKKGKATIKQPVFVSDVAQGIVNAVQDVGAIGKTFEIAGPERYMLADAVEFLYKTMRWEELKMTNIYPGFWLKAAIMSKKPFDPTFCRDRIEREYVTDILTKCPTLSDLGVNNLTSFADRVAYEVRPYRKYNYYDAEIGEFPDPPPPRVVTA